MPDRAVVDVCDICKGTGRVSYAPDGFAYVYPKPCPACTPRALVALSEDRQWAVLPGPGTTVALGWAILERQPVSLGLMATSWTWAEVDYAEDTGQDAHEVLAAWLEGRGG